MMITRENQRKQKISFPSISEKIFLGGYEENAKSAVINILGAKISSGSKKYFLRVRAFREMCRHYLLGEFFGPGTKNEDFFVTRYEENAKCVVINI